MRPTLQFVPRATVVALLLASTTLLAPAAHALPVFTQSDMDGTTTANEISATPCTEVDNAVPNIDNVPVVENGPTTTGSQSGSGTFTNDGDGTDTISFTTTITGTDKVTSVVGNPRLLELNATGSVSASASKPVSGCSVASYSYVDLDYTFTVAQAGFLTITTQATEHTYGDFFIENDASGVRAFQIFGTNLKFSGSYAVYLPAGTYSGYLEADAFLQTTTSVPSTPVKISIRAEFDVAGSQTAAPVGKASKYVALPAARSCATDSLDATVTPKKNRAKKIKQIKLYVNDKVAAKVKKPKKGTVVKVPVVDDVDADLRAVVTEVKKPNGKPGKVYEVVASYAPCS